ncbi:MAG: hypothetical protein ACYCUV_02155 [Phycisphaerae bacterium]
METLNERHNGRLIPSSVLVVAVLFPHICQGDAHQKGVRGRRLVAAVVLRLAQLQNVVVHYHDEVYLPRISLPPMPVVKQYHLVPRYGYRYYRCEFHFFHDRALYEHALMPISLAAVGTPGGPSPIGDIKSMESFMPSRTETLTYGYHSSHRPVGAIMNATNRRLPYYSTIDLALGLRALGSQHWMSAQDIRHMAVGPPNGNRFFMSEQSRGGVALRWNWLWHQGKVELRELTAARNDMIYQRIQCSKFHTISGMSLPGRIEETDWEPNGKHAMMYHAVLTHIRYQIGAKSNTAKSYYIVFPKGAGVLDERINQEFNVESGPRRLTDKAIFKLEEHYDTLPGQAMLPNASAVNPSLNPPALPIASSAAPSTGASRVGMPRWLLEVIAALATGGLVVVAWLAVKAFRRGGK